MISLAEKIEGNPEAKAILDSDQSLVLKVEQLAGLGIKTSREAIRLYVKGITDNPESRAHPKKDPPPKGWEQYSEWTEKLGEAIVHLPTPAATEHDLLIASGFDPDCWRIKGHVNTRKWMRYDQQYLYYYKFDVEQGESPESRWIHVEELVQHIRKRTPKTTTSFAPAGGTYVHVLSDWQIGKAEGGRGTVDTVNRYKDCLAQTVANIAALRRLGVTISKLAILSVGDLIEGCGDHYEMQQFSVDADRRSQNRIVRELITDTILTLSPLFAHTTIAVIGGNHGENRKDGKAYTTFADNDDVGSPEAVKEAFDLAGWSDRLTWHIPNEELSMCVDLDGVKVAIVHGHQFRGGANALKKAEDWWRSNDFGLQAVREAQILLSGHLHHYSNTNVTHGRSWIQAPTIDPGSQWFTGSSGVTAIPGVLNFVATKDHPLGYDYLRVLVPVDSAVTS